MNTNLLAPTKFKVILSPTRSAALEFFCTSAQLPGFQLNEVLMQIPGKSTYVHGDNLNYDPLALRALCDEELLVYKELFSWMKNNLGSDAPLKEDIILQIYGASGNLKHQIQFVGAHPTSVTGLDFNTQNTSVEYMSIDVAIRYDYFKFI